jgi:hypothetical protein
LGVGIRFISLPSYLLPVDDICCSDISNQPPIEDTPELDIRA